MAKVKFTSALNRFFPNLKDMEVQGNTVNHIIAAINKEIPGLNTYLLDDDGSLRKHVNIFVKDELIHDRLQLTDPVQEKDEVLIYQALSGG